jgi:two-component system, sensor histidine kinase and response regulator
MAVRDQSGKRPLRMIGTITDLSARKQTEEDLISAKLSSEHALAELASYIKAIGQHALISVTNLSGRIIEVNDRFCEITGYSREELLGRNHNLINSGVHPNTFFADLWSTISRGELWRNEICNRAKGGALYWVDTAIVPVKDAQGHISRYISVRLDITERKQTEAELMRAMVAVAVADSANAAKSAFLANMSHEIRTPMNTIIGMTHLALKIGRDPKQRDYLEKIQHSSHHLLRIINNILDFSKIEAGKFQLEITDFDPAAEISSLVAEMRHEAEKKDIELVFDIDARLSHALRGDTMRLRQVLLNYIGNAIKFTHRGKITVRARLLEESDRDCLVRFEVQDSGIGMSEEEIGNIFRPFHQADTSTTRNYGGTGLGLAISKQLAELMGGEVGVDSKPAQGSTFWFTAWLGRGKEKAGGQKASPPSSPELIKDAAILLVEDNVFNQQVASDLLEEAGAVVTIANNGQEALDTLRQQRFDCVLMDLQMPVMDGLEATRQIRANPAYSYLPVIGLTANAGPADQALCFKAGMIGFLSKPIDPARLLTVLAASLTQRPGLIAPFGAAAAPVNVPVSVEEVNELAKGAVREVDLGVLAKIVSHDPEKVRKYAQMFVSSMNDTMTEIEATLARVDVAGASALGHRAKSSARTVGATSFADLCQALENCTSAEDYDKARSIIEKMRPMLKRINRQIDVEINS